MTIFQKMLFVPIISLILYGSFISYSFFEHQRGSQKIQQIRNDYVPILSLANENIHLFEKLRDSFKDAVLANESLWLDEALKIKARIDTNLVALEAYSTIINKTDLG